MEFVLNPDPSMIAATIRNNAEKYGYVYDISMAAKMIKAHMDQRYSFDYRQKEVTDWGLKKSNFPISLLSYEEFVACFKDATFDTVTKEKRKGEEIVIKKKVNVVELWLQNYNSLPLQPLSEQLPPSSSSSSSSQSGNPSASGLPNFNMGRVPNGGGLDDPALKSKQ